MKAWTLFGVTVAVGFAVGFWVAPALVGAGLSMLGAASAMIAVLQVCFFAAEYVS